MTKTGIIEVAQGYYIIIIILLLLYYYYYIIIIIWRFNVAVITLFTEKRLQLAQKYLNNFLWHFQETNQKPFENTIHQRNDGKKTKETILSHLKGER